MPSTKLYDKFLKDYLFPVLEDEIKAGKARYSVLYDDVPDGPGWAFDFDCKGHWGEVALFETGKVKIIIDSKKLSTTKKEWVDLMKKEDKVQEMFTNEFNLLKLKYGEQRILKAMGR